MLSWSRFKETINPWHFFFYFFHLFTLSAILFTRSFSIPSSSSVSLLQSILYSPFFLSLSPLPSPEKVLQRITILQYSLFAVFLVFDFLMHLIKERLAPSFARTSGRLRLQISRYWEQSSFFVLSSLLSLSPFASLSHDWKLDSLSKFVFLPLVLLSLLFLLLLYSQLSFLEFRKGDVVKSSLRSQAFQETHLSPHYPTADTNVRTLVAEARRPVHWPSVIWRDAYCDRIQIGNTIVRVQPLVRPKTWRDGDVTLLPTETDFYQTRTLAVYKKIRFRDVLSLQYPFFYLSQGRERNFSPLSLSPLSLLSFKSFDLVLSLLSIEALHMAVSDNMGGGGRTGEISETLLPWERRPRVAIPLVIPSPYLSGPLFQMKTVRLLFSYLKFPLWRPFSLTLLAFIYASFGFATAEVNSYGDFGVAHSVFSELLGGFLMLCLFLLLMYYLRPFASISETVSFAVSVVALAVSTFLLALGEICEPSQQETLQTVSAILILSALFCLVLFLAVSVSPQIKRFCEQSLHIKKAIKNWRVWRKKYILWNDIINNSTASKSCPSLSSLSPLSSLSSLPQVLGASSTATLDSSFFHAVQTTNPKRRTDETSLDVEILLVDVFRIGGGEERRGGERQLSREVGERTLALDDLERRREVEVRGTEIGNRREEEREEREGRMETEREESYTLEFDETPSLETEYEKRLEKSSKKWIFSLRLQGSVRSLLDIKKIKECRLQDSANVASNKISQRRLRELHQKFQGTPRYLHVSQVTEFSLSLSLSPGSQDLMEPAVLLEFILDGVVWTVTLSSSLVSGDFFFVFNEIFSSLEIAALWSLWVERRGEEGRGEERRVEEGGEEGRGEERRGGERGEEERKGEEWRRLLYTLQLFVYERLKKILMLRNGISPSANDSSREPSADANVQEQMRTMRTIGGWRCEGDTGPIIVTIILSPFFLGRGRDASLSPLSPLSPFYKAAWVSFTDFLPKDAAPVASRRSLQHVLGVSQRAAIFEKRNVENYMLSTSPLPSSPLSSPLLPSVATSPSSPLPISPLSLNAFFESLPSHCLSKNLISHFSTFHSLSQSPHRSPILRFQ